MTEPLVAIIIVNFNGKDDTLKCLESLRQDRYRNKQIIVVDNGSDNDSAAVIRGAFPDVVLIETGKNLGFGGGNNVGIRHAIAAGVDYVYLLNNDTTSEPDALRELVKAAQENPGFGILAPVIHYMAEPKEIWFGGATLNPRTLEALHDNSSPPAPGDPLREIPWATGCAVLIPSRVISELRGFDERFFLYSEDVELSLRVRAAGCRIGLVPPARIYHKVGASARGSPLACYHALRGKLLLQRLHGGRRRKWISCRIAANALREGARAIRHGRGNFRSSIGPAIAAIADSIGDCAIRTSYAGRGGRKQADLRP
jgi:GT2 family glycosyltransferase